MARETALAAIPGGSELIGWFGRTPHFHDAELLNIVLASSGPSTLIIHTWQMTGKVDVRGYYELDKHVVVTLTLTDVTHVELCDFNLPGIIDVLEIAKDDEGFKFTWGASYGISGSLRAKQALIEFKPGKPIT